MQETLIVYYLHGQTGRFKAWVNGKQNSQIISINRKRLRRPEIGIKGGF